MKTKIIAMVTLLFVLTACNKTFYQVYKTKATNLEEKDNTLVFENDELKVSYNFWAQTGNGKFSVYNKTERDLFIVLPQSFMIKNGAALEYFKNREFRGTVSEYANINIGMNTTLSFFNNPYWYRVPTLISKGLHTSTRNTKGTALTSIRKETPIICIPPHAFKVLGEYAIHDYWIKSCNKKQDYPRKTSTPLTYTKDNTPLHVINRIAYSFDDKGVNLNYIENEFWISEIINYAKKEIISTEKIKECEYDYNSEKVEVFKIGSPEKFYNIYKRNNKKH